MSNETSNTSSKKWQLAQWLEIRWWKRYLKGRNPAAYIAWKTDYWLAFLTKITTLPNLSGQNILDAGCGPAGIFLALGNSRVTAIDPLLNQYATLPHFSKDRYPYVEFQTKAIEALSDTDCYDITFCLNAINHVADIQLSLDQLVKATRPGGTIVLSIDAHRHSWLMPLFRLLPGDALHPHQYDLQGYLQLVADAGCKVTEKILVKPGNIFDYWVLVGEKH